MSTSKEQQRRVRDFKARKHVHERKVRRLRRDNILAIVAVAVVGTVGGLVQWSQLPGQQDPSSSAAASAEPTASPSSTPAPVPDPSLAEARTWTGELSINGIPLGVELDGAAAPQAVASIISDAQSGYYAGKTCHRLTTGETFGVLQCGSLRGDGATDPGYRYGPIENAPADGMYPAGTIAMARAGGDANSNGHQFFIVYTDTTIPSDAAGGYSVVGRVTSGLDQLQTQVISLGLAPGSASPTDGAPAIPVTIDSVTLQ